MPSISNNDAHSADGVRDTDPVRQVQNLVEKKIRNLEKRKTRLEQLQQESEKKELNDDQKKALQKHEQVIEILDFFKDFNKSVGSIFLESQKAAKKAAKKEDDERKRLENERVKTALLYQDLLANLERSPKSDFLEGANGAVKLSQEKLDSLDALLKNITVNRQLQVPISEQIQASSKTLLALVYGKEKELVTGVTFREAKQALDSINESGYFDVKPEIQEPEPVVEPPPQSNDQILEQIPVDQTSVPAQYAQPPPFNFIQPSIIDPAIVSMQQVYHPAQFTNGGDLNHAAQAKFETHIPTQTYTNPNYANYGGGFVPAPVTLTSGKHPLTNQTIPNQTQFIQPAAQENNNSANENQTFDQNTEYAANVEHFRKSSRTHKNYNDDNNYNQGFRPKGNRGSGRGGYRGPRNQGANANGLHQPKQKTYNGNGTTNNKFTNGS